MNGTNIFFQNNHAGRFRTAVSLHGHTLHSRESLDFIYPLAKRIAPLRYALDRGEERYQAIHGRVLDLNRAWWTPPVSPYDAWTIETKQIENKFGLDAHVSLTDHDDIEAPMTLQVLEECRRTPISVEWTVPYRGTFFHIGVHNLVPECARETMRDLAAFTANPVDARIGELLDRLAANPATLIVFNHPNWDEKGIGETAHQAFAREFAAAYKPFIHAFELNGLRPWRENRGIFDLAKAFDKPLISGGDRHAMEPNAMLNLTNASDFAEFVEEIREGYSDLLITQQYLEPFALRILQNVDDVLSDQENHSMGWRRWSDRVFYHCEDGVIRSFRECWTEGEPVAVRLFVGGLRLLRQPQLKHAFRMAFARREQVVI